MALPYDYYAITSPRSAGAEMSLTPGEHNEIIVPEGPDIALLEWSYYFNRDVYSFPPTDCRLDFAGDGTAMLTYTRNFFGAFNRNYFGYGGAMLVGEEGNPLDLPTSAVISGLTPGTELIVEFYYPFDHTVYYSGPPWRNPDGLNHCRFKGWTFGGRGGNFTF